MKDIAYLKLSWLSGKKMVATKKLLECGLGRVYNHFSRGNGGADDD